MEFEIKLTQSKKLWDEQTDLYEEDTIDCNGQPDIIRYQNFEYDLMDKVLSLVLKNRDVNRKITLIDFGCGSGKLHIRYGCKMIDSDDISDPDDRKKLNRLRRSMFGLQYDEHFKNGMDRIIGIDFSENMIDLAKIKTHSAGLTQDLDSKLIFKQGYVHEFDMDVGDTIPIVACMINTIGIMQGVEGARKAIWAMERIIGKDGLGVISMYRKDKVEKYALCRYESVMESDGQPIWLIPIVHAEKDVIIKPKAYKTALHDTDTLPAMIFCSGGNAPIQTMIFRRDPNIVKETVETGVIRTHTGYYSKWYSREEMEDILSDIFGTSYKIVDAEKFDYLRGEVGQIAFVGNLNLIDELPDF
jgi:SAM-dependent methyltransferase